MSKKGRQRRKGIQDKLGKLSMGQLQKMQRKYCGQVLPGYIRNPTIQEGGEQPDYVNGQCALRDEKGFICTRRLPASCDDCGVYQEMERQWGLQDGCGLDTEQ